MGLRAGLLLGVLVAFAPRIAAQAPFPVRALTHVSDPSLTDAAMAVADAERPVIYYNPAVLRSIGPLLTRFVLSHEEAHIVLGHKRLTATGATDAARLRRLELEADCRAAQVLAADSYDVVIEAARYFAAQGSERHDEFHPEGTARSARILECANPAPARPGEATRSRSVRADAVAPLRLR